MAVTKSLSRRTWCIFISTAVAIVVILAVAIPLAIILPKRNSNTTPKATLILPLYVYPTSNTTWSPLYTALEAHPHLNFTVIVNPSSGPGTTAYPNDEYSAEVQKLNAYPNVETIGYVRTGYASRNISTVMSEVATYAGWSSKSSGLAMHGIFFDEAPYDYSATAAEYMQTINQAVKSATGLQGLKTIVHNPGTIPDTRYNDTSTDVTVVFEDSYTAYQTKLASLEALPKDRSAYAAMVVATPTLSIADLTALVDQLAELAAYVFVTNNQVDYYESFGSQWDNLTYVMPT